MFYTEYETTVVLRPDLGGDAIESTLDRVRDSVSGKGGKLLAINHWGRKRLAYEIEKHTRGVYVHAHYLGSGEVVSEIERNFRITDTVLRFLTVKLADRVVAEEREAVDYVPPSYDAAELDVPDEEEPVDTRRSSGRDRDDDDDDDDDDLPRKGADDALEDN